MSMTPDPVPSSTAPTPGNALLAHVDENNAVLAAAVHLLFFASTLGLLAAGVAWATRGRRDRGLALQCAQAIALHALVLALSMLLAVGFVALWIVLLGVGAAGADTRLGHAGGTGFVASLALLGLAIVVYIVVYVGVGAVSVFLDVRCLQRRDPWLPLIGPPLAGLVGHTRVAAEQRW